MNPPPQALLIVCLRYLGDTLLLRPAFHALRAAFPAARLDALVTGGTACALDDCAHVNRVLEWPRQSLAGQVGALGKVAAGGYDWVVDFTGNDRSAFVALVSRARLRAVYDRPKLSKWSLRRAAYTLRVPPEVKKPHILVQRQKLLEACGVPSQGFEIDLVPRPEALRWAEKIQPQPGLHAHLTSRDMQKAIPAPMARAVFQAVLDGGGSVTVTSGSALAEREHIARCTEGLPAGRVRVFSDLSWHQLVALISRAGQYWGADTAPAHIAAALRKPMLIHYGPSQASHWKPLHPEGRADVRACECLKAKKVLCPRGEPGRCLASIDPAEVLAWLRQSARPGA